MKNFNAFLAKYSRIMILLLIFFALSFASSNFLTANNLINVLRQASMLLIMALGLMCAMLLGRDVDISIGSTLALSSCVAAFFFSNDASAGSIILGILIALAIGLLIGAINGSLIAFLSIPAILATFGTQQIFRGLVYIIMGGSVITDLNKSILYLGAGRLFNQIPMPIIIALVLTLIIAFMLKRTRIGREFYIVGANEKAAGFSGIKTKKAILTGFMISGLMASLAGIVYLGRLGTAEGEIGQNFAFQSIAAAAIGGVSFRGGVGTALGTVIGALILTLLNNGMNLLNISSYWQGIVNGAIIIGAILIDYFATKKIR